MASPPWKDSESQMFVLITGANSGLGLAVARRMIDEFLTSSTIPPTKHLILILCTRSCGKTESTIQHLDEHLVKLVESSLFLKKQSVLAKTYGKDYLKKASLRRIHFLGAEVNLCDLNSIYALANKLIHGDEKPPTATNDPSNDPSNTPSVQTPPRQQIHARKATQIPDQKNSSLEVGSLRVPRIDNIILCAGTGGWLGIDTFYAFRHFLIDPIEAVTWPKYKIPIIGALVNPRTAVTMIKNPQKPMHIYPPSLKGPDDPPPLGEVFCSNIFGHYMLAHKLMPLLSRPETPASVVGGKIIWVSSVEALDESFSIDDFQGISSKSAYESSKRLIDIIVLGSELQSVFPRTARFYDLPEEKDATVKTPIYQPSPVREKFVRPRNYVSHPGIFASRIMPVHYFLAFLNICISYIMRFFGSPWHTIDSYKAALAPVSLALMDHELLMKLEDNGSAKAKWGSATDAFGHEKRVKTEVPGWGYNGKIGGTFDEDIQPLRKGRHVILYKEAKDNFEQFSRYCWDQMEELRKEWEAILGP